MKPEPSPRRGESRSAESRTARPPFSTTVTCTTAGFTLSMTSAKDPPRWTIFSSLGGSCGTWPLAPASRPRRAASAATSPNDKPWTALDIPQSIRVLGPGRVLTLGQPLPELLLVQDGHLQLFGPIPLRPRVFSCHQVGGLLGDGRGHPPPPGLDGGL